MTYDARNNIGRRDCAGCGGSLSLRRFLSGGPCYPCIQFALERAHNEGVIAGKCVGMLIYGRGSDEPMPKNPYKLGKP